LPFSKEKMSGLEESQKPRAVANTACTGNLGKTIPGMTIPLSTVTKSGKDEKKEEDLVDPKSVVAKMAGKQDGADCRTSVIMTL
jgi:hypothetical protein